LGKVGNFLSRAFKNLFIACAMAVVILRSNPGAAANAYPGKVANFSEKLATLPGDPARQPAGSPGCLIRRFNATMGQRFHDPLHEEESAGKHTLAAASSAGYSHRHGRAG